MAVASASTSSGTKRIRTAFATAAGESRDGRIVVERYLAGKDYRILVVDKRVVAVAERVPAHVVGDGVLTVGELVEIANADPRRGIGHEKVLTRIPVNERTLETLARQGLALDSVPDAGQHVRLQQTGNMSTGGTSIDRTDEIHPVNAEIARQAAMIIGLDVAGVDMIAPISPAPCARPVVGSSRSTPVPASACTPIPPRASPPRGTRRGRHALSGRRIGPHPDRRRHRHQWQDHDHPHDRAHHARRGSARRDDHDRRRLYRRHANRRQRYGRTLERADGVEEPGRRLRRAGDRARGHRPLGLASTAATSPWSPMSAATTSAWVALPDAGRARAGQGRRPQSVFRDGASVLNADNEWTVRMAETARGEIIFFDG